MLHFIVCLSVLVSRSVFAASPLTPSAWLLKGDDVARRVVAARLPQRRQSGTSVWLEFQRDPRFRGNPSNEVNALRAVLNSHSDFSESRELLREMTETKRRPPYFFVTWHTLGIRAINRLTDRRIYPIGLTPETLNVDGKPFPPRLFLAHDVEHAAATEDLIHSDQFANCVKPKMINLTTAFYRTFSYAGITAGMDKRTHLLFDLAYFIYFHELAGDTLWNHTFAHLAHWPDTEDETLRGSYGGFGWMFRIHFEDDHARVRLNFPTDFWVNRFLDRKDLYVNLPLETKCQVGLGDSKPVVAALLEEALSIFFTEHYLHARNQLRKSRGSR